MTKKLLVLNFLAVLFLMGSAFAQDTLKIWYGGSFDAVGNWKDTTVGRINSNVAVPFYIYGAAGVAAGSVHFPLGVSDTYINDIVRDSCSYNFFPFNAWDDASFLDSYEALPGSGFHTRSFLGFADLGGGSNPWGIFNVWPPAQKLTWVVHTLNNAAWNGTTVAALVRGQNSASGGPTASDSLGSVNYVVADRYAYLYFSPNPTSASDPVALPMTFSLDQNYPNPFNSSTEISFCLPVSATISLEVYDMMGNRVKTLVEGHRAAGLYKVNWDGTINSGEKAASGTYVYRLKAGTQVITKKMVMLK
jgi:hypothetical protein